MHHPEPQGPAFITRPQLQTFQTLKSQLNRVHHLCPSAGFCMVDQRLAALPAGITRSVDCRKVLLVVIIVAVKGK